MSSTNKTFLTILIAIIFIFPLSVSAYDLIVPSGSAYGLPESNLVDVLEDIIKWVIGFIILIAILMIVWAGINYMTAAGDQNKVEDAKKILTYAILGLILALTAWAIVKVIIVTILGYAEG